MSQNGSFAQRLAARPPPLRKVLLPYVDGTVWGDHSRTSRHSYRAALVNDDARSLNARARCLKSENVHGSANPQVFAGALFKLRFGILNVIWRFPRRYPDWGSALKF